MAIRQKYIGRIIELFKEYMYCEKSLETFEEVRYKASQLGKELFKEKVPLDWIVGLYIEAVRSLESEAEEENLDLSSCRNLLLEMVMTYSTSFLKNLELTERLRESEKKFERCVICSGLIRTTWPMRGSSLPSCRRRKPTYFWGL